MDIIYNNGFWDSTRDINKAAGAWDFTPPPPGPPPGPTSPTETKEEYITVCGLNQPIRFGSCRRINLTEYLPSYLRYGDTEKFLKVFEDFLNDLYPGYCGLSAYDVEMDNIVSASEDRTYDYEYFTEGNIGDPPASYWSPYLYDNWTIQDSNGVNVLSANPGYLVDNQYYLDNIDSSLSGDFSAEIGIKLRDVSGRFTLRVRDSLPIVNDMKSIYIGYFPDSGGQIKFNIRDDGVNIVNDIISHPFVPYDEMQFRLTKIGNIIRGEYNIGTGWEYFPSYVDFDIDNWVTSFRFGNSNGNIADLTYINISADGGCSHPYTIFTSAVEQVTNIQYLDQQIYSVDTSGNLTSATPKYSILEKINRLTELHDPTYMDEEYLQFFANYLGYNVNINFAELGTLSEFNTDTGCSEVDKSKYLRFVIENLPNWYKIKTTKNAVRIMLYSFGIIGDLIDLYTKGKYEGFMDENDPLLNSEYYPSPHFAIVIDLDASVTSYSFDYEKRDKIIRAIESIKPVNTVFEKISGKMTRIIETYPTVITKSCLYQRVNWVD